ncbi:MAG: uracil-DNA glycosylase, partial [Clostridia bacterium]
TSCADTKVVIMGQDPYFGEGQAQGLCFSVGASQKCPPSLVNIFKAINIDLGVAPPVSGDLTYLAKQGVLLLNTTLSVRKGQPLSHAGQGWETLTNAVIALLNECQRPIVFMLWGQPSIAKAKLISAPQHLILTAPHPSPLSAYRGFFECKHFSKANDFLIKNNLAPIKWTENAR